MLQIYRELDVKSLTEKQMIKYFDKAFSNLKEITIEESRLDALYQVSKNLIERKS